MKKYVYQGCRRTRVGAEKGKKRRISHIVIKEKLNRTIRKDEVVHHINGNTSDNRIENLQVMTISDHMKLHHPRNSSRFGVSAADNKKEWARRYRREQAIERGTKPRKFKITEETYFQIMNLLANNYKQAEIAQMFDVDPSTVSRINSGKQFAQRHFAHNQLNPTIKSLGGEANAIKR